MAFLVDYDNYVDGAEVAFFVGMKCDMCPFVVAAQN